jgi:hypothetical protein
LTTSRTGGAPIEQGAGSAPGQLTGPAVAVALISAISGLRYGYEIEGELADGKFRPADFARD